MRDQSPVTKTAIGPPITTVLETALYLHNSKWGPFCFFADFAEGATAQFTAAALTLRSVERADPTPRVWRPLCVFGTMKAERRNLWIRSESANLLPKHERKTT